VRQGPAAPHHVTRCRPVPGRALVLTLVLAFVAGCSSGPSAIPPGAPEATRPAAGTATPPVTPREEPPAGASPVARLLEEAAQACADGDLRAGLAKLDRALRIAPQDAGLYLEMARCYRRDGDAEAAAAAAERGLSYCRGDACRQLRGFL